VFEKQVLRKIQYFLFNRKVIFLKAAMVEGSMAGEHVNLQLVNIRIYGKWEVRLSMTVATLFKS
jgi:hypothetical protein